MTELTRKWKSYRDPPKITHCGKVAKLFEGATQLRGLTLFDACRTLDVHSQWTSHQIPPTVFQIYVNGCLFPSIYTSYIFHFDYAL